jgi:D-lactate dehydrogenase (quinone)
LFSANGRLDAIADTLRLLPQDLSDKIMQMISHLFPEHLPKRMKDYRDSMNII